ncbi:MAG: 3-methyl-2-oxobutanoate hydroxymethyltransferase [Cellvibrionaceae bacterium]
MSTYNTELTKAVTLNTLRKLKADSDKFTCVALYDAPMAALAEKSGVEIVLVGDSLGMTVQGHDSTLPVTINDMVYHTAAVKRGNQKSLIIADMPFMTYSSPEQAATNAGLLMQAGAHMVKLEGGDWLCETVTKLNDCGIPVCAHLGLTPQSVNKLGGYRVQGREQEQAEKILQDTQALADAGADLVVLECVPAHLGKLITEKVDIMTIGIGAGADTHAQVLVINDMIGITEHPPKFSKNFLTANNSIADAIAQYVSDVKSSTFPTEEHSF